MDLICILFSDSLAFVVLDKIIKNIFYSMAVTTQKHGVARHMLLLLHLSSEKKVLLWQRYDKKREA